MKPMSVLAVCAALATTSVLGSACKKDEPASETHTTSAPITPDQPVVTPQTPDQMTTGTVDNNNNSTQPATTPTTKNPSPKAKGTSTTPSGGSDLIDRGNTDMNPASSTTIPEKTQPKQQPSASAVPSEEPNHSTSLGDGKSGTYTDGKGTHGGKATWGTGPQKDTKMDQPTP